MIVCCFTMDFICMHLLVKMNLAIDLHQSFIPYVTFCIQAELCTCHQLLHSGSKMQVTGHRPQVTGNRFSLGLGLYP